MRLMVLQHCKCKIGVWTGAKWCLFGTFFFFQKIMVTEADGVDKILGKNNAEDLKRTVKLRTDA